MGPPAAATAAPLPSRSLGRLPTALLVLLVLPQARARPCVWPSWAASQAAPPAQRACAGSARRCAHGRRQPECGCGATVGTRRSVRPHPSQASITIFERGPYVSYANVRGPRRACSSPLARLWAGGGLGRQRHSPTCCAPPVPQPPLCLCSAACHTMWERSSRQAPGLGGLLCRLCSCPACLAQCNASARRRPPSLPAASCACCVQEESALLVASVAKFNNWSASKRPGAPLLARGAAHVRSRLAHAAGLCFPPQV